MKSQTNAEHPYKLTIKELKELIRNTPDDTEVRISSIYERSSGAFYHTSVSAVLVDNDAYDSFFILEPYEIKMEEI